MKVIHKYELEEGDNLLSFPPGSKILSAHNQDDQLMIWVLINKESTGICYHKVVVYTTGEEIVDTEHPKTFIGTVLFGNSGTFVLHVFEDHDFKL